MLPREAPHPRVIPACRPVLQRIRSWPRPCSSRAAWWIQATPEDSGFNEGTAQHGARFPQTNFCCTRIGREGQLVTARTRRADILPGCSFQACENRCREHDATYDDKSDVDVRQRIFDAQAVSRLEAIGNIDRLKAASRGRFHYEEVSGGKLYRTIRQGAAPALTVHGPQRASACGDSTQWTSAQECPESPGAWSSE